MTAQIAHVNGIDICYETFGDANAEPMVLIMGLGAQMIHWDDEFCRQLAARGFRVVRFDNRDIGKSSKMSGGKRLGAVELLKLRFLKRLYGCTTTDGGISAITGFHVCPMNREALTRRFIKVSYKLVKIARRKLVPGKETQS